jgi:cephalosporin-C deacetylase-like acetyl esterase
MKPVLTPVPVPKGYKGKVESFDVKINCPGGAPVSGYFSKPVGAKPKSLPAIITYHGAGVRSSNVQNWRAAQGMLALDINAHGIENGKSKEFYEELRQGKLKGYPHFNKNSKDKIYFLGMFLRVYRSLQFMKSQPEWDGKTLIVSGSSQGGGQALVAAGLEPKVSFCAAMVPALCDHLGIMEKRQSGWPRFISFDRRGKPTDQDVVDTVPYFDAATFAKRINADSIVSVGFIDTTCCPTSVYAAYNNIKGKKEIINNPLFGHKNPKETTKIIYAKINEHIKAAKEADGKAPEKAK